LKSITRRDLLLQLFSGDTLKHVVGACKQFTDAKDDAGRISCDNAGLMLGMARKRKENIMNSRKEGSTL